ncbi:MAG: alpha-D-ribose 1-methylphosphonate 5-triphosphate diphosphatase [Chloroflexales bacterium]|nr:alpha-D-ribose 1-methylphosphonate 5-triphosphate diphosphatase [Chloroflexales bacterium]
MRTLLTNARIVLPNQLIERATLLLEDDRIAAIDPVAPRADVVVDLAGALLLPGLVDLHCDALEKDVEPRPNALFPLDFAVATADRRSAFCGITTIFHAVSFAHGELGVRSAATAAAIVASIAEARQHTLVDNRVHARYEVTDPHSMPLLGELLTGAQVDALSFMDHTPGQGQFKSLEAYQRHLRQSYGVDANAAVAIIDQKRAQHADAYDRVRSLATLARAGDVPLISHDDDSPGRVARMAEFGVRISEFPVNLETARAATAAGMHTVFGAPNVLRGQSQSGSMRAIEAVRAQVAACLCSDYAPSTLLAATLRLPQLSNLSLPQAVGLVTANPAHAVGLRDRGELAVGLRADCIAVDTSRTYPQVAAVWVAGCPVLRLAMGR